MEEAQRFIRYVVPGLVLIIEILVYFLISGDITFAGLLAYMRVTGVSISGIIASGGLGFLLGVVYYTIIWKEKILTERLKLGVDHRPVLKEVESKKWVKFYCPSQGKEVQVSKLTKRGAWRVVVSYLSTRREASERIKGSIPRMERLANLANGLGTTCLASFIALFSFVSCNVIFYNFINDSPCEFSLRGWMSFVAGLVILGFHYCNYRGVLEDSENVFGMILLNELELEYKNGIEAVKLYVFENDLKKA